VADRLRAPDPPILNAAINVILGEAKERNGGDRIRSTPDPTT
jgi:hypothetical protein